MSNKRIVLLLLAIFLTLTAPLPLYAQGEFYIDSDAEPLDAGAIMEAAQPLMDRGAIVAIYFVQSGQRDEFNRRLRDDGLAQGELLEDNLIAIFVSLGDRYSEIAYGNRWAELLRPRAEGIKSSALDSNLREGVYTRAYERALEELDAVIGGTFVPPVTSTPSRRITPEDSKDSSFNWTILIAIGFIIYGFFRKVQRMLGYIDEGPGPVVAPRYKSSWTRGYRASSGRSSISRSSSRSSGRSFGGGGRSGGKW